MEDNRVSVESVELALLSEIEMSSALLMKDAYPPESLGAMEEEKLSPSSQPERFPHDDESGGPNARIYVTKLSHRTPPEEIEKILKNNPGRKTDMAALDFYTLVLSLSMRLGDPSKTRFLNGTIEVAFPHGVTILSYSPKDKGTIPAIIRSGREAISLSPGLVMAASPPQGTKIPPDPTAEPITIPVGPGEKISGAYSRKNGYILGIPAGILLEYQGMLKNQREMFWEIFPPMPVDDSEITGKERQVIFSFIVQTPKSSPPRITARIDGRVKGNLWGVVPVKGSVVL